MESTKRLTVQDIMAVINKKASNPRVLTPQEFMVAAKEAAVAHRVKLRNFERDRQAAMKVRLQRKFGGHLGV